MSFERISVVKVFKRRGGGKKKKKKKKVEKRPFTYFHPVKRVNERVKTIFQSKLLEDFIVPLLIFWINISTVVVIQRSPPPLVRRLPCFERLPLSTLRLSNKKGTRGKREHRYEIAYRLASIITRSFYSLLEGTPIEPTTTNRFPEPAKNTAYPGARCREATSFAREGESSKNVVQGSKARRHVPQCAAPLELLLYWLSSPTRL